MSTSAPPTCPHPARAAAPLAAVGVAAAIVLAVGCELVSGVDDFRVSGTAGTTATTTTTAECGGPPAPPADACIAAPASCGCGPGQDTDCDGLRDQQQDPWPPVGNPALLIDDFATEPAVSGGPSWQGAGDVGYDDAAQAVWLGDGAQATLVPPCSKALDSPDYLVEVAFTIYGFVDEYNWRLTVLSALRPSVHRDCSFFRKSGTAGGQPNVELKSFGGQLYNGQIGEPAVGGVSDGSSYLLQSWGRHDPASGEQRHYCRLLSPDGTTELSRAELPGPGNTPIDEPGTIGVAARGLGVWVTAVRAFEPGS